MKQRYSIWGREHGAERDVEICQVNANPEAMKAALYAKTLKMVIGEAKRKTAIAQYTNLRIVENTADAG